ncbi:hypothetical protein P9112_000153 [Eukaryota sp. TZLM1-RC]
MRSQLIILSILPILWLFSLSVGGWVECDPEDEDVQNAAHIGVSLMPHKENEELIMSKVLSAKSQVVAGINYLLVLEVKSSLGGLGQRVIEVHRTIDNNYQFVEEKDLYSGEFNNCVSDASMECGGA